MARTGDGSAANGMGWSGALLTAVPLSMSCLYKPASTAAGQYLMEIKDVSAAGSRHSWYLRMQSGGGVGFGAGDGAGNNTSQSVSTMSAGTWYQIGGKTATNTSRFAYLDGVEQTEQTTSRVPTPGLIDILTIGTGTASNVFNLTCNGDIAETAIWNVALTQAEMAVLAKHYSPLFVRPANLVFYCPIFGNLDPEPDLIGTAPIGTSGTSMPKAAHPRVIYPSWFRKRGLGTAGAAATGQIKYWDGSAWVLKPVKYWNGSSWVTKPLKRWTGSAWVLTP